MSLDNKKVLIVDDDGSSKEIATQYLSKNGYSVVAVADGAEGIKKAQEEKPDLILLDIMLPDMNGYEICKKLKGNPQTKDIPVFLFTGKDKIDDIDEGFKSGADDYIMKTTDWADIIKRIEIKFNEENHKTSK